MTAVLEEPIVGSQEPLHLFAPTPETFRSDHASDAVEYAAFYGLTADEWQATTINTWMRVDTITGRWLASTWVITVSRQNGKNGILEIVQLYAMTELNLKFLHTAHEVKTARKAFIRLKHFFGEKRDDPHAKYPDLNALVQEVRNTNGQEAIILKNGGSVEFIARSKGSGRGFTVDVLVCDEAQDMQDSELEALKPTISAAPSGDPVTIYLGTPPAERGLIGEPFVRVRDSAISGTSKRTAWVEFGAKGDLETMSLAELEKFVKDQRNWADGNPAWGTRINQQTIEDELETFSAYSFARERLNMWPASGAGMAAIPQTTWRNLRIPGDDVGEDWPVLAYGLDMNPERTKVIISVAVDPGENGPIHLELAVEAPFDKAGTSALVDWLWVRAKRRVPVIIDSMSPARSFAPLLKKKRMKVYVLGPAEFGEACGNLYTAIMTDASVTHPDQKELNESIKGVFKEKMGNAGAFKWNRVSLETDLGPIIAITCVYYGAIKFARRRVASQEKKRHAIIA